MPDAVLPEDFSVVGDNLRLSADETRTLIHEGRLALGGGEFGRLGCSPAGGIAGEVDPFVEDYDRDASYWRQGLARGPIASAAVSHAQEPVVATVLSPTLGGFRAAWQSPFGESLDLFLPFSLMSPSMRAAPWGTLLAVFVHRTDHRNRWIEVCQDPPPPPDDLGISVRVETSSTHDRVIIEKAIRESPTTLWFRSGLQITSDGYSQLSMRVAAGEEFAVFDDDRRGVLRVGNQTGCRLKTVDGPICRRRVGLVFEAVDDSLEARTTLAGDCWAGFIVVWMNRSSCSVSPRRRRWRRANTNSCSKLNWRSKDPPHG